MKRLFLLAAALCACSLRAPRNEAAGASCTSQNQCHAAPTSLSTVSAEVRPGNDSALGLVQAANLDLGASTEHDFVLTPAVLETGSVTRLQDDGSEAPASSATVVFTGHAPAIADRVQQVRAQTDGQGAFSARLPAGLWDVVVQPQPPSPPLRLAQPFSTSGALPSLKLPAPSSLLTVAGTVSAAGADLSGATVAAVDAQGNPLSAAATVGADGGYSLLLPPGTGSYLLEVGAPSPADAGVSPGSGVPPNLATLPSYDKLPGVPGLVLPLPPVATLAGVVVSAAQSPLPGVPVFARSTADEPWTLARSTVTDSNGAFSLQLREGTYVVEAAPATASDQPATSAVETVVLTPAAPSVTLVCPEKVRRQILVLMPNGRPVEANFQIVATRLSDALLLTRSATTTSTERDGSATIIGDPGTYRVEVVPPAGSGFPVRITNLVLDPAASGADVATLQIQPAIVVTGEARTAVGRGTSGVSGATVSFFTKDPQTGASVLLCSAATDPLGQYTCILPDGATP
ncbi:MAG TPA: carboxypeptidase-like regulatory domain-containing protein [Myxococcales bacterium]